MPFIISSCICRSSRCPSDGLHSCPDRVRLNSWESLRSVIKYRSMSSSVRSVFFRLVLQPPLVSRGSDVSVVR
jgi:hypothetical protein